MSASTTAAEDQEKESDKEQEGKITENEDDKEQDDEKEKLHLINQANAFDGMVTMFSRCDNLPLDISHVVNHIATTFLHEIINNSNNNNTNQQRRRRRQNSQTNSHINSNSINSSSDNNNNNNNTDQNSVYKILDIGCGCGVLFRYLLNEANKLNGVTLHIVGVDVSKEMIEYGKLHAANVLNDVNNNNERRKTQQQQQQQQHDGNGQQHDEHEDHEHHTIDMIADDFIHYLDSTSSYGTFDGVIANSCFANFFDIEKSFTAMVNSVKNNCNNNNSDDSGSSDNDDSSGGIICIAHPIGTDFVKGLNTMNPYVTPHLMPNEIEYNELLLKSSMMASTTTTTKTTLTKLNFHESIEYTIPTTTSTTKTTTTETKRKILPMYYASAIKK